MYRVCWVVLYQPVSETIESTSFKVEQTLRQFLHIRNRILVQGPIYRRIQISRDGHLDQSEAYDIS